MVICLEQGADLHMAQLMPLPLTVSCFSEIQIGSTFLVPAHPGSPGQRAVKWVCVCVYLGSRSSAGWTATRRTRRSTGSRTAARWRATGRGTRTGCVSWSSTRRVRTTRPSTLAARPPMPEPPTLPPLCASKVSRLLSRSLCSFCSVLFFSRPRPEAWPHHGRTFSIYPCPLSL